MNTIKIELQLNETQHGEETGFVLDTTVYIDNEKIKWDFIEPFQFFKDVANKGVNASIWHEDNKRTKSYNCIEKYSTFEPFSCSCGSSGCAGIWGGIMSKHRGKTVEWRTTKEDGYKFLKRFYSFNKEQYYKAVLEAWEELHKLFDRGAKIEQHGQQILLREHYKNYYVWGLVEEELNKLKEGKHVATY